jgi:hypothetical protein
MVKVQNPEVVYEFSLHQHVQNSSLPTQLCIQNEQRDNRSNGVNVTTCLLQVLRSRIFGVHLHVLEVVVTFAFLLRFLIGLFMERHPHFTHPSYKNKNVTHKIELLIGVYSGH